MNARGHVCIDIYIIQLFNGCGCNRPNYLSSGANKSFSSVFLQYMHEYI
jgi:hypothetical protein